MATATTPEHVETHNAPFAGNAQRVEVRKVAIDGNTLSVLAVGIALFALAFGAFTHLSGRIDSLDSKLSGRMDGLDAKLSGRMDGLDAKMDKLSAEQRAENREINARLDRLFELMAELRSQRSDSH